MRTLEEKQILQDRIINLETGDPAVLDSESGWSIYAVPGGWIYSKNSNTQSCFVPRPTVQPVEVPVIEAPPTYLVKDAHDPEAVVLPKSRAKVVTK